MEVAFDSGVSKGAAVAVSSVHVHNPFNNSLIRSVVSDDYNSADAAIVKAQSYDYKLTAWQRYIMLHKSSELLLEQRQSFSNIIARESGKTIKDAMVEVLRAHQALLLSAEEAKRITGEVIPLDAVAAGVSGSAMVIREPIGLVAAITPFNFPLNLVVHKVGPALAANNPVIVKPSEKTPLTALKFRALLLDAGFPACMIQVLIGEPNALVKQLVSDSRVSKVSFTGSVPIGRKITRQAGLKPVSMELGGNDPMIILADTNIESLIPAALDGAFGTNGERCTSVKRFIVEDSVADEFSERLVAAAKDLVVGDQLDSKTDIGPLIDVNAARVIEQRIQASTQSGAVLLCGGHRVGALLWPTILDHVTMDNPIVRDETFGPVAPIIRVEGIEHAISVANDTQFGLQSGVFTDSLKNAKMAIEQIRAGAVMINRSPGFRAEHLPFGGIKSSGYEREGIRYAIESMTTLKTVVL